MPDVKFIARFEILVVLLLKIQVIWDVTHIVQIMPEVSKDCVLS